MQPNPFEPTPVVETTPPREPRRRGVVGPVILILLGLAFLVSNLNLFNFNVWEMMWRLWPVWLIAVGLDMLVGRRTSWGGWLVLGLVATIVAGAMWFYGSGYGWVGTGGTYVETSTVVQEAKDFKEATVSIRPGVGEIRIGSTSGAENVVEGTIHKLPGERIVANASGSNGHLDYTLRSEGSFSPRFNFDFNGPNWDLRLSEKLPMDLDINTGVGKAEVDLSRLTLTRLDLTTGIGESRFVLPAQGTFNVSVKSGIGKTTIEIPREMAARIRVSNGIGHIAVSGSYRANNGYYESANYDSAKDRVEVHISGGIGEIVVRER